MNRRCLFLLLLVIVVSTAGHASGEPAVVGTEHLDQAIDEVLADPHFSWRLGRKNEIEDVSDTSLLGDFLREIAEMFAGWADAIMRWLAKLRDLAPTSDDSGSGSSGYGISVSYLLWALMLACVSILSFLIWRRSRGKGPLRLIATKQLELGDLAAEESDAASVAPETWRDYAHELAAEGKLREAIRAVHLATLSDLSHRNLIRLDAFKSNRDYLFEVRRRKRVDERLPALFAGNIGLYETVWYGRTIPSQDMLQTAFDNFERIEFFFSPPAGPAAMSGRISISAVVVIFIIAVTMTSVLWLLHQRFDRGDLYPAYSSLRSDPLGSEVLFEALCRFDPIEIRRNLDPLDQFQSETGTTLLVLGHRNVSTVNLANLEHQLSSAALGGSRIVLCLSGFDAERSFAASGGVEETESENECTRTEESKDSSYFRFDQWGISVSFSALTLSEEVSSSEDVVAVYVGDALALPEHLNWHSPIVFVDVEEAWRVIYGRGEEPVMVERRYGRGSLVLASDSFFISNEALLNDRHTELLTWLIGSCDRVVFDETHLGVYQTTGVMVLVRRYRLHGFFAGLTVLVFLFVWRTLLPLAPSERGLASRTDPEVRTSRAALANLLHRALSDAQLLSSCVAVWKQSCASSVDEHTLQRLEELAKLPLELQEGYRLHHELIRVGAAVPEEISGEKKNGRDR